MKSGSRSDGVHLIVSIDTEEDNWHRSRHDVTMANIREVRPLSAFLRRLGARPTYFTTYQVAKDPESAEVLREACEGGAGEIGAHLHPWNTPPLLEPFVPRNSMLNNLPAGLQLSKLRTLTAAMEDAFDFTPEIFRAGRYGLGRDTVAALACCGYRVDSSVSPFINLEAFDHGPTFVGAPFMPYRLAPNRDVREHAPDGTVLEIPLSSGFSRGPFHVWGPARRALEAPPFRWFHLAGLAAQTGLVKRLVLCPELATVDDMLTLSRRLLDHGVRHLQLSWHSPTLLPGLSPFAATFADVKRIYASVEAFVDGLSRMTPITFSTVTEVAAVLG